MLVRKFSTHLTLSVHSGIVMRDFILGFYFSRQVVLKTIGCTFLLYTKLTAGLCRHFILKFNEFL